MYQLQGELEMIYIWEKENVLSYTARIKEIADRIEGAHRLINSRIPCVSSRHRVGKSF